MVKIRPAKKEDLKGCEEVFHLPELRKPDKDYLPAAFFENYLSNDYFLVAEEGDEVVAAIYGEELVAKGVMVWLFAVKEEYRGNGIGNLMYEQFEANCRSNKKEWIYLVSPKSSEGAVSFYKKQGFDIGDLNYECVKELS